MSEGLRTQRDRLGFTARHRFLLFLLWAQVPVLAMIGLAIGVPPPEVALASLTLAAFALLGMSSRASDRLSMTIVGLALMIAGFVVVDFAEGATLAHAYFFLALAAVAIYRDRLVLVVGVGAVGIYQAITAADVAGDPISAALHSATMITLALLLMAGWRLADTAGSVADDEGGRFRISFEQAPIGMAVVKPSGELVDVNEAMANILHYDQETLIGSNIAAFVHPDDQGELGEAWEEMGNSETHSASEWMRWIGAGGHPVWSRVSLALVPRALTAPAMVILQLEAASEAHQEQRRLEMLVQGKDEFVAAVGDEIREPLDLLIDLTDSTRSRGNVAESLPRIGAHAQEIASIVDNLVVSARASTRPVSVVAHHLDAETLCRSVISAIPTAGAIEVDFRAADVWADPNLTRQIVASLVNNAIRYGGPNVELRTVSSGPDTVIEVIDDGPEIPITERERVFSGDLRSGSPVTRPATVGLSLTVGRLLARQMDGDIEYRRTSDGRNVFELRLPAEQISEAPHRISA